MTIRLLPVKSSAPPTMTSISPSENTRPPTTAKPSGRRDSAPAPSPNAMGNVPTSAAMVVIMIGRKRTSDAS